MMNNQSLVETVNQTRPGQHIEAGEEDHGGWHTPEKYKILVSHAPTGIFVVDRTGRYLEVNDAACKIAGFPRDDLLRMSIADLAAPEARETRLSLFRDLLAAGEVAGDVLIRTKQNERRVLTIEAKRINDDVFVGYCTDVTAHKASEKALQVEKNKLNSVIEAMPFGLTIQDTDFNILFQNQYAANTFGGLGGKCYRVYERREEPCEGCPVQLAFEDGQLHTSQRTVTMPTGELGYSENTANPIRDSSGKIVACLEIVNNITERTLARKALTRSEINNRTLVEGMPDAVIVCHEDAVQYLNPAAVALLGYQDTSSVIGTSVFSLVEPKAQPVLSEMLDLSRMNRNANEKHRLTFLTTGGDVVIADTVSLRLEFDELPAVMLVARDVTEIADLRRTLKRERSCCGMVGNHHKMQEVYRLIRQVAPTDYSVLLSGETGTGKELVASAVHFESHRADKPFVAVNCGALPDQLLESELFGHVRGAFTGAVRDKKGQFECANGGTLFLDEIGDLSVSTQVKLLRVLQEHEIRRVGAEESMSVNVRVVGATNKDLQKEVRNGRFRQDLFFRLCVVPIVLPSLRERPTDILLLAHHFLTRSATETHGTPVSLSDDAAAAMVAWRWPGNVRELQNSLKFALIRCAGETIDVQHLPPEIVAATPAVPRRNTGRPPKVNALVVRRALEETSGNKMEAAKLLGIGRTTLYRYV